MTFRGTHTLGQFLGARGTSLPFNVAHAVGNVVFCLAFGPAFVRALQRFRARLDVTLDAPGARRPPRPSCSSRSRSRPRPLPPRPRRAADAATRAPPPTSPAPRTGDGGFGAAAGQRVERRSTPRGRPSASPPRTATPTRAARRALAGRLRRRAAGRVRGTGDVERTILALARRPLAAARGRRRPAATLTAAGAATGRSDAPGQPHRVRASSRCAPPATVRAATRTVAPRRRLARAPAEPRRRLRNFAGRGGAERRRRHRAARSRRSSRRGRSRRGAVAPGGAAFLAARPERRTAASACGPGRARTRSRPPGRSRGWSPPGATRAACAAADRAAPLGYLRTLVGLGRQRPLLAHERPDAGLGHGPGARPALARRPFPVRAPRW